MFRQGLDFHFEISGYAGKEKIMWKRGEIAPSPLFHNIFNISLTSIVQSHIYLLNVVVRVIFSSVLQIRSVEVRISRSISEGPLEFEITRVDCSTRNAMKMFSWRNKKPISPDTSYNWGYHSITRHFIGILGLSAAYLTADPKFDSHIGQ